MLLAETVVERPVEGSMYWKVYLRGRSESVHPLAERTNLAIATAEVSSLARAAVREPPLGALFTAKLTLPNPVLAVLDASSLKVYVCPIVNLFFSR